MTSDISVAESDSEEKISSAIATNGRGADLMQNVCDDILIPFVSGRVGGGRGDV